MMRNLKDLTQNCFLVDLHLDEKVNISVKIWKIFIEIGKKPIYEKNIEIFRLMDSIPFVFRLKS